MWGTIVLCWAMVTAGRFSGTKRKYVGFGFFSCRLLTITILASRVGHLSACSEVICVPSPLMGFFFARSRDFHWAAS